MPASLKVIQYVRPKLGLRVLRSHRAGAKRRAGRSNEALLGQGFWRMCWYRNIVTIFLSIVRPRSMLAQALSWIAQLWRSGSADPAGWLAPLVEALRRLT